MLELRNIDINYNKKILECQKLSFPKQGLCIIKGESGSGKTSLIRCLTMETPFYEFYLYNNKPMTQSIAEEKISLLNQNQEFIEELSVGDHIKMIEKVYSFAFTNDYISKFDLQNLLNKYPNQLSGGEKTRVALLLKIMKQAEILILDEPTSSLDIYYTNIISDFIKKYAQTHLVIVCTHDEELIKEADFLYEIVNKTIVCNFMEKFINKETLEKKNTQLIHFPLMQFCLKLKKRRKLYHSFIFIGIAILILLSSFGISLHFHSSQSSNTFSSVYQDEILVYKGDYGFSGNGYEFPFTQQELESLKNIKHVKTIQESYIYKGISDIVEEKDGYLNFAGEDVCTISLWNDHEEIKKIDYRLEKYSDTLNYCSYNENIDYSKDIDIQFQKSKNGVYISKAVAEILGIDKSSQNYYLEFTLMIPVHQIYGDAVMPYQNEDGSYSTDGDPLLEFLGNKEKVRLPINGILKSSNMGVGINKYLSIFFSNQYIHSYLEKYKSNQTIPYYWLDTQNYYVRNLKENDIYSKKIVAKPYQAILYRLQVDDIINLEQVNNEIEKLGFSTITGDYSTEVYKYEDNTDQMIMIISIDLIIILNLIYAIVQYLHKEDEKQTIHFLKSFGFKRLNSLISKKYLVDFFILDIIIFILGLIYTAALGPLMNYPIHFSYTFIPIALLLSFIIMFIIPLTIYKLRK